MCSRLVALACLAASATVFAQGDQAPERPQQTFRAAVNLVRVDMYATQDGAAVEDLMRDDVTVLEDGVPQAIESFEFVKVAAAGPQETRREPSTVQEMRDMTRDARARVFVIFLDSYHTQADGSANMRVPLVRFLDRVLGEDDLVALMTPEMPVSALTFARKTMILSDIVSSEWWGRRASLMQKDSKEALYEACYGLTRVEADDDRSPLIADLMRDRRREMLTLDALEGLVTHLRDIREERKAVLAVTEGWLLFREDGRLTRVDRRAPMTGPPPFGVRGGQVALPEPAGASGAINQTECDTDRVLLATMDNSRRIVRLGEDANRANVSFYPVYARGLTTFDAPVGPDRPPLSIADDRANLSARQSNMRDLAAMTDGTPVINTNDLTGALTRIADDLSSYYLMSYYSTNQRLDGRFREITVRVNRPGVRVRARRGYRAATAADLTGGPGSPGAAAAAVTPSVSVAVNPRAQFRVHAAGWTRADGPQAEADVWLVGELDPALRRDAAWASGGRADVLVMSAVGAEVVVTTIEVPAGGGSFTMKLPESAAIRPGEYAVRIRMTPQGSGALPLSDTVRVIVGDSASALGEPVMWRRGLTTGPRFVATADPRFRRSDRIRLELPAAAAGAARAAMLDRQGRPMQIPVQVTERPDENGAFRWIVAEAALAPLAPGDYAIEVSLGSSRQVGAFRIVP